jgi:aminocarboxymuconate-semialdehyde decarboxylase
VLDPPGLTVLAARGGGYLPYYIGRSDHAVHPESRGPDYPYDMGTRDPLALLAAAQLSGDDRAAIEGGNAARLLGGQP